MWTPSDSFYYRAIRTRIGETLRSQLVPTEPPPRKVVDLLQALDRPCAHSPYGASTTTTADVLAAENALEVDTKVRRSADPDSQDD
jgi:hypothetical protein